LEVKFICSSAFLILLIGSAACSDARDIYPPFEQTLTPKGGEISLHAPQPLAVPREEVVGWVDRAATALTHFYGRYPVKHVDIYVYPGGEGVNGGVEYVGRRINAYLGDDTTRNDLLTDWMITHEMFHLSQPDIDDDQRWMSEGMADYLEPVARVRIGQITPEKFWGDLVEGMPQGLPGPLDGGLDHTHTWGRTYWGGSMFWLLADIRTRQQTNNQKSVRDAARAVLDAGGDGSETWSLKDVLTAYDHATGTHVFAQLNEELGEHPGKPDLNALWKSLGVVYDNGKVTFDNTAPLASIRQGITAAEKQP
jgi:hypothetical protein